jgi:hypothetical protein
MSTSGKLRKNFNFKQREWTSEPECVNFSKIVKPKSFAVYTFLINSKTKIFCFRFSCFCIYVQTKLYLLTCIETMAAVFARFQRCIARKNIQWKRLFSTMPANPTESDVEKAKIEFSGVEKAKIEFSGTTARFSAVLGATYKCRITGFKGVAASLTHHRLQPRSAMAESHIRW